MVDSVRVSAVVLRDRAGQVLTVRTRGTTAFMLPGGEPNQNEADATAAIRGCEDELGVALDEGLLRLVGVFEAPTANEPGRNVLATVFEHPNVLTGSPETEIVETKWVEPDDARAAPLLRETVFPALQRQKVTRVTVFTGSVAGNSPVFAEATASLARALADAGVGVVYGGGRVGLMGVLADAALEAGGTVLGVMPQALVDREVAHEGLTRLDVVPDMHARKLRMANLSDAFVALPGGAGTLEELFEAWTWQNLGVHSKPVALYDVDGYWQPLLHALDVMTEQGFLAERFRASLVVAEDPQTLLAELEAWAPQHTKSQTQRQQLAG